MKKINFTNKKVHYLFVSVVTVLLITVMVLNVFLMYNMAAKQTEEVSSIYMQNIAARLQETLTRAENSLIRIGANLEEVIEEDSSDTKIQSFLADQKRLEAMLSDNSCLNVFCVLRGNVMISDMQPPEHYVIQDRLWYSDPVLY